MVSLAISLAQPAALLLPYRDLLVNLQDECHNAVCILRFGKADLEVPAFKKIRLRKLLEAGAT